MLIFTAHWSIYIYSIILRGNSCKGQIVQNATEKSSGRGTLAFSSHTVTLPFFADSHFYFFSKSNILRAFSNLKQQGDRLSEGSVGSGWATKVQMTEKEALHHHNASSAHFIRASYANTQKRRSLPLNKDSPRPMIGCLVTVWSYDLPEKRELTTQVQSSYGSPLTHTHTPTKWGDHIFSTQQHGCINGHL